MSNELIVLDGPHPDVKIFKCGNQTAWATPLIVTSKMAIYAADIRNPLTPVEARNLSTALNAAADYAESRT